MSIPVLTESETRHQVRQALASREWSGKSLLLIIPDHTRSAPIGQLFQALHAELAGRLTRLDVLIALGTHPPMTEEQILARLDLTPEERATTYGAVQVYNHAWQDPDTLRPLGVIPAADIDRLSEGLFSMDVPVSVNRRLYDYDEVLILGPVFPHEVVGFSGGYKYLFPGVSGQEIIDFFHWLGAVITNPRIIGHKHTPVRAVLHRAADLLGRDVLCLALVVGQKELHGLFFGETRAAWEQAADLSARVHIQTHERPYHTVLSQAPTMYDDLWVGAKCMYKLENVVADGGELIIYAPHLTEISYSHGRIIRELGYHCRDYFRKQWDRFRDYPWGVIAHCTHCRGIGTFEDGVERCRIRVTLATGIPEETCRQINLGYRDPATIDPAAFAGREPEGVLHVPKAGEILHRLADPPDWQQV